MRRTSASVSIRVVNESAKQDATMAMPDLHPLTSLAQIRDDKDKTDAAPTFELNMWTSGAPNYHAGMELGAWSGTQAGAGGAFTAPPVLTATLTVPISTAGITITFGGDCWPSQTVTTWYIGTTVLATQTDAVSGYNHFVDRGVDNYNKVTIAFSGTIAPYRRVRIAEIDFGQILIWAGAEIIKADKTEEVNLTSAQLPFSTVNVQVHDDNQEFNILNPLGIYKYLQQKQRITLTETVDGVEIPMGKAYLEKWNSETSTIANFTANCALWLFDGVQYASPMWSNATASTIFSAVFGAAGWTDYEIHDNIGTQTLSGYIPTGTVRAALQQACFALRASCMMERDGKIHIRRLPASTADRPIDKDVKAADGQKIEQEKLVNSIVVTAYTFTANTSGSVDVGGTKYNVTETKYTKEAPNLTAATRAQESVSGVYLVSTANGQALADWLYADRQRRIKQSFKLILDDETVGTNVDVDTMMGQRKVGIITKMKVDMTGGFLADVEVRG